MAQGELFWVECFECGDGGSAVEWVDLPCRIHSVALFAPPDWPAEMDEIARTCIVGILSGATGGGVAAPALEPLVGPRNLLTKPEARNELTEAFQQQAVLHRFAILPCFFPTNKRSANYSHLQLPS